MENVNLNLLNEVISFLEEIYGSFDSVSMNKETKIEKDLKITGDEAAEFLIKYGKKFKVNVSGFLMDEYFKGEGYSILECLGLRKSKVKKNLTVGDLVKGIKAGVLNEEVIGMPLE